MKKILHRSLLAAALLAVFVSTSQAQIAPEKEAEIRKMINVLGLSKMMNQMMDQMMASFQANAPKGMPQEFWTKVREKMRVEDMIEQIIPLYDKYLSLEDLKAVNIFYASPAGQRILATMPQLMHDSMLIGQQWGQKVAKEVIEEISAEKQKLAEPKQ